MNKGGAFFLGAVLGLTAGIFLAPKSGEENLADAKEFAKDVIGQGQAYYQQGVQAYSGVRPSIDEKNDQLQAKIDAARKIISEQVAKNAEAAKQAIAEAAAADEVEAEAVAE